MTQHSRASSNARASGGTAVTPPPPVKSTTGIWVNGWSGAACASWTEGRTAAVGFGRGMMLRGEFLRGELRGELPAPGVRAGEVSALLPAEESCAAPVAQPGESGVSSHA